MAADREPPTLADYAVTAASPALVMLMVGSLVFFLVEVLYAGQYSDRLLYTMFFFVFGAVLVARIAIQLDAARAGLYGAGLAVVTFLAMMAYVDYPPGSPFRSARWLVNLGLMGVVWWNAHKLTWDCTHIDENRDASGRGLLAAAGLETSESERERGGEAAARNGADDEPPGKRKKKKRKKGPSPFSAWVGRWRTYRESRKDRPHIPGVWVVYFALAALPLFALGQSLIPPDDAVRRRATFLQMTVYVGSALGLLVTTSLLGLRRYLRQRKTKIPAALTAGWLGLGVVLIAVFLTLGAFLPRPHSEVPWFGLTRAGQSEREASKYAQVRDAGGKGEGADGDVTEKGNGKAAGKNGQSGGTKGAKGQGGSGDKSGKGDGSQGGDAKGNGGKDGKSRDAEQSGNKTDGNTDREAKDANDRSGDRGSGGRSLPDTRLGGAVAAVAGFLKWVVMAVVVFLVLAAVAIAVLRYLAPFTAWAQNWLDGLRNWWANLFGGKKRDARAEGEAATDPGPQRPRPFSDFSNPFTDGSADQRDTGELVEYTFAALDAWAWDRGHGRAATETPLEFASRLGDDFPELGDPVRRFAHLYARTAYSERPLPPDAPHLLEHFWDNLIHGPVPDEVAEVD